MRRKSRNLNAKTPLRDYALAGASSVALAALIALSFTRTVQADARLLMPASTAPASLAASATPTSLAQQPAPKVEWKDRIHGIASWYGGVFNGRKTASGERFDMNAMTACHPSLPFGSIVKVVNRSNKRAVVVKITDRGDLEKEGRVIDLSYGAAKKLAMVNNGLAKVDLQVISLGDNKYENNK
ncbi:MAG TPA: septal ring lytic transglycosylase RlpA family protein [Terracidiphilus sp.]|nr:septal ring lytic transglycosylase RlpA family protein [Terracidiphilus sp.]